ncbi:MAG: hypothetical protein JXA67_12090 [Micromonosporaceae bacterium]|nr:hypothetical protein [Micromonosporaceae bacterium]
MLGVRLQGDAVEARALLEVLRAAGAEVQFGGSRNRGDFWHVYATVQAPRSMVTDPVLVTSVVQRPALERG